MKRLEKQTYLQIIGILIFTAGIYIAYSYTIAQKPSLESRASADTLKVTLQLIPQEINRTTVSQFQLSPLLASAENKIGYIQLAFRFDPAAVKFSGFKEPPQSLKLTELSQPDQSDLDSGLLLLMFGADTTAQTQGGSLQLPKLYFDAVTPSQSEIRFVPEFSQIVFESEQVAIISPEPDAVPIRIGGGTETTNPNPEPTGTLTPTPAVTVSTPVPTRSTTMFSPGPSLVPEATETPPQPDNR